MANLSEHHDVVVVGAGNAALCAAIAAADEGASVVVLEKAPQPLSGGNSRFTGALLRFAFDAAESLFALVPDLSPAERDQADVETYSVDDYFADVMRLSNNRSDPRLIRILVDRSYETMEWYRSLGIEFELYEKSVDRGGLRTWPDHAVLKGRG